ncbi:hypothetical protein [Ideonella dechloratans]|uniref:hypothetical protein n=1 Tax=Ideonella dechloratans TaxID=36863 RepID=UPI0035ADB061
MSDHLIDAEHVRLSLVARRVAELQRRANPAAGCRWAAMSAHLHDISSCSQRRPAGMHALPRPSMLLPMHRGNLDRAVQRMRLTQGLAAIRKTFGAGLRAVLAETGDTVMR